MSLALFFLNHIEFSDNVYMVLGKLAEIDEADQIISGPQ